MKVYAVCTGHNKYDKEILKVFKKEDSAKDYLYNILGELRNNDRRTVQFDENSMTLEEDGTLWCIEEYEVE